MNAAELVSLCCAHGIDFIRVAGSSNNLKGLAGKRRRVVIDIEPGITEESRKRQRIEAPDTVKGKGARSVRAADWGSPELAMAAYGVKALHWAASQHTLANDRTPQTIKMLFFGLRYHANQFATETNWETVLPARIERDAKTGKRIVGAKRASVFYVEPLCMLVLDEISYRPAFTAAPALFSIYLGVEQETWESVLEARFRMLQGRYAVWYGSGLGRIQRRINGEADELGKVAHAG